MRHWLFLVLPKQPWRKLLVRHRHIVVRETFYRVALICIAVSLRRRQMQWKGVGIEMFINVCKHGFFGGEDVGAKTYEFRGALMQIDKKIGIGCLGDQHVNIQQVVLLRWIYLATENIDLKIVTRRSE